MIRFPERGNLRGQVPICGKVLVAADDIVSTVRRVVNAGAANFILRSQA